MTVIDNRLQDAVRWGHMRTAAQLLTQAYHMISDAVDEYYKASNSIYVNKQITNLMVDATDLAGEVVRESKKLQNSLNVEKTASAE